MPTKIQIIFYSMYGHIYKMAQAVEAGAKSVPDTQVSLFQVKETLPDDVLAKMGALEAKKAWAHVPIIQPAQLAEADGIIFGIPTRYGLVVSQMQTLFDATGQLWMTGALVGKVGSIFTSTGTQHGGQETTIVHAHTFLFHQGMVVAGVPYACANLMNMTEITGGSPYGASTMAGPKGDRQVTENELTIARYQGKHVAEIAGKLKA
ncbi:MAG: NAD(P)H:quinone oxidoreductase, type [Phycisphaerales bacterium]|nr:NAD(P)H:quinone oxidoreductase, type [Phycisphaerales bacterium]